jgi:hypothetical protein
VQVRLDGPDLRGTAVIYLIPAVVSRSIVLFPTITSVARCLRGVWPVWHPETEQEIDGVPPGEYLLEAWGSQLLSKARVSVKAGTVTHVELVTGD